MIGYLRLPSEDTRILGDLEKSEQELIRGTFRILRTILTVILKLGILSGLLVIDDFFLIFVGY